MAEVGEKRAIINMSTATTTSIITGVSGEYWQVIKAVFHSSGINQFTIKSNTTAICGPLDVVAQWRMIWADEGGIPWLRALATGDDLKITTTQAVQLSGLLVYKSSP